MGDLTCFSPKLMSDSTGNLKSLCEVVLKAVVKQDMKADIDIDCIHFLTCKIRASHSCIAD